MRTITDRETALIAVANDGLLLGILPENLQLDREIVLTAVTNDGWAYTRIQDPGLLANREIILTAVSSYGRIIRHIPYFRNDTIIMYTAISNSPFALKYASPEICNNKDLVMLAVSKKGMSLQYASEALKDDYDVAITAVSNIGSAIQYVSKRLRNNYTIVKIAVSNETPITQSEILPTTITNRGRSLRFASSTLQSDREIVLAAVSNNGSALGWASPELQDDREIVLTAVTNSAAAFCWASPKLRKDREILLKALANNFIIAFCIDGLLSDVEIVNNIFADPNFTEKNMIQAAYIHPSSLKHAPFVRNMCEYCRSWKLRPKYNEILNLSISSAIIDDLIELVA